MHDEGRWKSFSELNSNWWWYMGPKDLQFGNKWRMRRMRRRNRVIWEPASHFNENILCQKLDSTDCWWVTGCKESMSRCDVGGNDLIWQTDENNVIIDAWGQFFWHNFCSASLVVKSVKSGPQKKTNREDGKHYLNKHCGCRKLWFAVHDGSSHWGTIVRNGCEHSSTQALSEK